jgi:imidazolonepropionase-like amidohydrolase
LRAATGVAAACIDKSDRVGTIEPGRWADLVALDKDPLADVRNSRTIRSVWVAGNELKR